MNVPETRYALTREGVCIAYQVFGEGPHDLIYSPGWVTNIEVLWEWPDCARVFTRLARNRRVVIYDKQGTGLSDRVATLPDLDARMDDILAVMRATGMDRPTLLGPTQGAALSAIFAATYPDRVEALVTYGGFARGRRASDWPFGDGEEELKEWADHLSADEWGTERWAHGFASEWGAETLREDPAFLRWLAKLMRFSATPTAAAAFGAAFDATDVRHILPAISVPTLLLHRANQGEREEVELTASLIPLARSVELPADHWSPYLGDPEPMATAIENFLTGVGEEEADLDRVLATVLFTDIVGSTDTTATLGDQTWRELVERHHTTIRAMLVRYRGTEVDTAGDGFFVTFDGPARAVRCAQAIIEAVRPLGVNVRTGVHTGEVTTINGKIGGLAVNIGARVGAQAGSSEVLVSQTVKDLTAGSGLIFEDAGEHELKGVPDSWRLYRVMPD